MLLDRTSEAIAHFIGLFGTIVEDARERLEYDEFLAARLKAEESDLPKVDVSFTVEHELVDFEPGVKWQPTSINILSPDIPSPPYLHVKVDIGPQEFGLAPHGAVHSAVSVSAHQLLLPEIEPLGSVANYINQMIGLSDNDYFNVGGSGLSFNPTPVSNEAVMRLAAEASEFLFQTGPALSGGAEALKEFAEGLRDYVENMDPASAPENVFIHKETTITGTYVNGELVDEAPKLDDHFSFDARVESVPGLHEPLPPNATTSEGGIVVVDQSVEIHMGENTLVNSAVLSNLWTGSPVMAVAGDHTELNVIVQVNAHADQDSISGLLKGWHEESATETFNIASFQRKDPLEEDEEGTSGTATGSFPEHWVVTTISGDLMIVNWIQQITFMSDNDIGIASSSGATAMIYAGNNTAVNTVSLYELGLAYDLIVIGNSVYDINLIQQMNVLYDNDLIGAVEGFHTSGEGSIDTSDNLLWNEAHIYNVGSPDRFEVMSDEYREAVQKMADGDLSPNALLNDPLFQGANGALRVLYIEGDLINVQSITQTNILGDADQLALAMHKSGLFDSSDWTISTGDNALVNLAAITDIDSLGKIIVGGEQYSQELLVQADIISTQPELGWQNPDALVNEAVAFLSDNLDGGVDAGDGYPSPSDHMSYDQQGDGVQSMLG